MLQPVATGAVATLALVPRSQAKVFSTLIGPSGGYTATVSMTGPFATQAGPLKVTEANDYIFVFYLNGSPLREVQELEYAASDSPPTYPPSHLDGTPPPLP